MKQLKLILWTSVLVAACLPAQAQSVRFKIPFDFTAGAKQFSAGEYLISASLPNSNRAWTIRNVSTGEVGIIATTSSVESPLVARKISLMFHCSEGEYSLFQLWPNEYEGRVAQPPSSKVEYRRLANAQTVEIPATKGN